MNYFFSSLFRDKMLRAVVPLAALAGLIIVDLLTYMLTPRSVFNLWVVKITVIAAFAGAIGYGVFLQKKEKNDRRLDNLLPGFMEERRGEFKKKIIRDPVFQTFCHECRYFDVERLRCLLVLPERKVWVRLDGDSPVRHCLYWNLDDRHPVMQLTKHLKKSEIPSRVNSERQVEKK